MIVFDTCYATFFSIFQYKFNGDVSKTVEKYRKHFNFVSAVKYMANAKQFNNVIT